MHEVYFNIPLGMGPASDYSIWRANSYLGLTSSYGSQTHLQMATFRRRPKAPTWPAPPPESRLPPVADEGYLFNFGTNV